jgi:Arm DNA-binding domain
VVASQVPFRRQGKRISLGTYPDTSLANARDKRDAVRKLLATGVDPGEHRKAEKAAGDDKAANSFEVVAREWFAKHSPTWVASHADKIIQRLERDVCPWLGKRPTADITEKELLATVNRI